jgi:hypothetical protein
MMVRRLSYESNFSESLFTASNKVFSESDIFASRYRARGPGLYDSTVLPTSSNYPARKRDPKMKNTNLLGFYGSQ